MMFACTFDPRCNNFSDQRRNKKTEKRRRRKGGKEGQEKRVDITNGPAISNTL